MRQTGANLGGMPEPRQPKQDGFTIVETIIVLAIASLILSIILFAIPALQRNSRNNQRNQDIQAILEAVSHWELNHSGNIPGAADNYLQASSAKLTYYVAGTGTVTIHGDSSGSPASIAAANNINKVDVYNYQKCSTTTPGGSTAVGAGYSDIVALYAIETKTAASGKCQQL